MALGLSEHPLSSGLIANIQTKIMNPTLKKYLISSGVTFATAFLGMLALELKAGIPDGFTVAFVFSLVSVAARAGVKAVIEWIAVTFQSTSSEQQ